jgi:fucose 4-O-acetylase-like acetyltransferase
VERLTVVDIGKGIGMILVVAGHAAIGVQSALGHDRATTAFIITIYAFHMAFFFAVSGAFARGACDEPPAAFGVRLLTRIVWPYFLWSLVLQVSQYVMRDHTNFRPDGIGLLSLLYWPPGVMWFLYALFFAFLLMRLMKPLPAPARWTVIAALLVAGHAFDGVWLIWHARFIAIFLFAAELGSHQLLAAARPWWAGALAALGIAVAAWAAWLTADAPLAGYPAGEPWWLPAAAAGVILMLALSGLIDRLGGPLADWLAFTGARSLPIFVTHVLATAGVRIGLVAVGVDNRMALTLLATFAGVVAPLIAYAVAGRLRLRGALGWR